MERNLPDLDLIGLFSILKKSLQASDKTMEAIEELKKSIKKLKEPSFGKLFHIQDIAELLKVTENTVYRYINRGQLASIKIGNRHVFYEKDIKDFLDKNYKRRVV